VSRSTMHVQVKLFATFRQYLPPETQGDAHDTQVPHGTRVGELLFQLGVPTDRPEGMVVLVNGRQSDLRQVLQEGDIVGAFPAMAGG
jgi:molybdopterin converting factor small subunit